MSAKKLDIRKLIMDLKARIIGESDIEVGPVNNNGERTTDNTSTEERNTEVNQTNPEETVPEEESDSEGTSFATLNSTREIEEMLKDLTLEDDEEELVTDHERKLKVEDTSQATKLEKVEPVGQPEKNNNAIKLEDEGEKELQDNLKIGKEAEEAVDKSGGDTELTDDVENGEEEDEEARSEVLAQLKKAKEMVRRAKDQREMLKELYAERKGETQYDGKSFKELRTEYIR